MIIQKLLLLSLAMASLDASAATFQRIKNEDFPVNLNLITSCGPKVISSKVCDIGNVLFEGTVNIPAEYAGSSKTTFQIETDFANVEETFSLVVAGSKYTLSNSTNQEFALPAGMSGQIKFQIVGNEPGEQTLFVPFKANISKIVVKMDGSDYIAKLLASLADMNSDTDAQRKYYNLQKKYVKWFAKALPEVER